MADVNFLWIEEPGGNVEHIAEHDLTPEDIECAYEAAWEFTTSRSSGRQCWSETFVSEAVLTRCLTKLRKVVQADRTEPPVIKTLQTAHAVLVPHRE